MSTTGMRSSGIPAVGELPWGAHFCQFYGSRDDLVDSLVPYFKAGLENNEQCLWVTSEPFSAVDARTALRQAVPDLDARAGRGQIEIIDHRDWYMRSGDKTADQVLEGWVHRHDEALAQGYDGLRLTGNTYWLERNDWSGFVDYEAKVTQTFSGNRIIGLCSYCSARCQASDVLDVIKNHQFAIARDKGEWHLIESAALKLAKEELRKLNSDLEKRVQVRTRELQEALQTRDQFLSVASHELKTPITSLQLYVDGLLRAAARDASVPAPVGERLQKAKDQCGRLEKLINNLLDVSRASTGMLPLEPERMDLSEVARGCAERMGAELARAACTVTVSAAKEVSGEWDKLRLDQVVTNLLSNAARYAPGSKVQVRVWETDREARLSVEDDGPGISERHQQRIFERFVQVDHRNSHGGFGLGLWIIKQIVEAHGGTVGLTSSPGLGSAFHVRLPR